MSVRELSPRSHPFPQGSLPALITPMTADGDIDLTAFRALIDWHVEAGSDGLVVAGTTGESATLRTEEQIELLHLAVEHAADRIPIIAGVGSNSTGEAIELTSAAQDAGVIGALSVVPYYNKPPQEGLYRHFRAVAEAVDLPMLLYNVPGRTVADLAHETVLRLAGIPNIVGLKDATGDMSRGIRLLSEVPPDFAIYSGDDESAAALLLLGARGVISVTANIVPTLMAELCRAARACHLPAVRRLAGRLAPLSRALLVETNPIPAKWALSSLGRAGADVRSPLTTLSAGAQDQVRAAILALGLHEIEARSSAR